MSRSAPACWRSKNRVGRKVVNQLPRWTWIYFNITVTTCPGQKLPIGAVANTKNLVSWKKARDDFSLYIKTQEEVQPVFSPEVSSCPRIMLAFKGLGNGTEDWRSWESLAESRPVLNKNDWSWIHSRKFTCFWLTCSNVRWSDWRSIALPKKCHREQLKKIKWI